MVITDFILQCSTADKLHWALFFNEFPQRAEIEYVRINKNDDILVEGEPAENVYVLVEGKAKLNIIQRKGFHYIFDKGEQTTIFGELEAIKGEREYFATVTARSDCGLLAFSKETYLQ